MMGAAEKPVGAPVTTASRSRTFPESRRYLMEAGRCSS
jgi:hypothetical protein